jgi:glycosyltransferase involved in cell wall biosynthesis
MKKQRLLFFDFVTHFGGAQRSTVLLLQHLSRSWDVQVVDAYGVCDDYLQALHQAHLDVRVLQTDAVRCHIGHINHPIRRAVSLIGQIPQLLQLRRQLCAHLAQVKPDVVLTNSYKALALLFLGGGMRQHRIAFYARGWYRKKEIPRVARWLIKRSHCVLAVSQATAEALAQWRVAPDRIHVIHTIVDRDGVRRDSQPSVEDRPSGMDAEIKILLPAQLVRTKGQTTAIEAARLLKAQGLDFVMWLCGDVKMGVSERYRQDLCEAIERHGLDKQVLLLGQRNDVRALMAQAQMLILPTHTEGFPRCLWEAMLIKCPVIATPAGGVTDLIVHNQTGLLFGIDDSAALAQAIGRLAADRSLGAALAAKAYDHVCSAFAVGKTVSALNQAIGSV